MTFLFNSVGKCSVLCYDKGYGLTWVLRLEESFRPLEKEYSHRQFLKLIKARPSIEDVFGLTPEMMELCKDDQTKVTKQATKQADLKQRSVTSSDDPW